jgi:D-amino-acid dehydrogenase
MGDQHQHVAVIGGGVIGAMCAWYLVKSGRKVTIVDQGKFGAGCSHGNCGYVSPSHVLPLPKPGAIKNSMRMMRGPNSPLSIKFPPSLSLTKWLWQFQRRCNSRDMLEAATARNALLQSSMSLYEELVESEQLQCEWKRNGLLFVFLSESKFEEYAQTDKLMRENFDMAATPYDGNQLTELEPALKPGLGGAWHYTGDRHLRPDKLMSELRVILEARGVEIIEDFSVDLLIHQGNNASAIADKKQAAESIQADAFIVATGAMTPLLNDQLGCKIPIQPGKGYSITMPCPEKMPKIPMLFEEHRVGVTPMETNYKLGSMMEFAGYDSSLRSSRLQVLRESAAIYLHDPFRDPVDEEWFGWRPMTWDGKPIIDCSPALENVWIAAGHNMLGVSMATATGKLIQQLVSGEEPHIDPEPYSISRFI